MPVLPLVFCFYDTLFFNQISISNLYKGTTVTESMFQLTEGTNLPLLSLAYQKHIQTFLMKATPWQTKVLKITSHKSILGLSSIPRNSTKFPSKLYLVQGKPTWGMRWKLGREIHSHDLKYTVILGSKL